MKRIFLKDYTHAQKLAAPVASREENGEAADKRANKPMFVCQLFAIWYQA